MSPRGLSHSLFLLFGPLFCVHDIPTHTHSPWNAQRSYFCIPLLYKLNSFELWGQRENCSLVPVNANNTGRSQFSFAPCIQTSVLHFRWCPSDLKVWSKYGALRICFARIHHWLTHEVFTLIYIVFVANWGSFFFIWQIWIDVLRRVENAKHRRWSHSVLSLWCNWCTLPLLSLSQLPECKKKKKLSPSPFSFFFSPCLKLTQSKRRVYVFQLVW